MTRSRYTSSYLSCPTKQEKKNTRSNSTSSSSTRITRSTSYNSLSSTRPSRSSSVDSECFKNFESDSTISTVATNNCNKQKKQDKCNAFVENLTANKICDMVNADSGDEVLCNSPKILKLESGKKTFESLTECTGNERLVMKIIKHLDKVTCEINTLGTSRQDKALETQESRRYNTRNKHVCYQEEYLEKKNLLSQKETNFKSTSSRKRQNAGEENKKDTTSTRSKSIETPKRIKDAKFPTPAKNAKTTPTVEINRTPRSKSRLSCSAKLFDDNGITSSMKHLDIKTPKRSILCEISTNRNSSKDLRPKAYVPNYCENSESEDVSSDEYTPSSSNTSECSDDIASDSSSAEFQIKTPSKKPKNQLKFETPSKKMAKQLSKLHLNALTPSVPQRISSIAKPATPLQEARMKLHVSALPKSLPCREEEFNNIYTFLHARLSDNTGGCIYISGVPGTGKTATVNEVIRCLKKAMSKGQLDDFEYVEINGMKLSEPRQAYVQIWKQLTDKNVFWEEAQNLLQARFSKPKANRKMTLLLVDELDLLCTKRQDVVYNLLDWPGKNGAKLVVVTIANTMDLPERILMGKVTSRLGLTRLTFSPYNFKQLEEIVISRLKDQSAFSGETVQLVARKVAAVSGDARRALDICRRSTEIAESNGHEQVTMIDVKKALEEMIASPKIQAIKHCSDFEKVFLQAVCAEIHRTGIEEVEFTNVYHQMQTLCTFNGEKSPNVTEALGICNRLGSWRLLLCEHSRQDIHQRIVLNVSTDDVQFATKDINS